MNSVKEKILGSPLRIFNPFTDIVRFSDLEKKEIQDRQDLWRVMTLTYTLMEERGPQVFKGRRYTEGIRSKQE